MHRPGFSSRGAQAHRLQEVTLRVPEIYAPPLRLFADELRRERRGGSWYMQKWRGISPSFALMVDSETSAWAVIRDTHACGIDRFRWSIFPPGQSYPVAEGRTVDRERARMVAEVALRAYAEDWLKLNAHPMAGQPSHVGNI